MTDLFTQIKQTAEGCGKPTKPNNIACGFGTWLCPSCKQKLKSLIEQWEKENKRVNREEQSERIVKIVQKEYPENSREAIRYAITLAIIEENDIRISQAQQSEINNYKRLIE